MEQREGYSSSSRQAGHKFDLPLPLCSFLNDRLCNIGNPTFFAQLVHLSAHLYRKHLAGTPRSGA